jgi:hypothetical protein
MASMRRRKPRLQTSGAAQALLALCYAALLGEGVGNKTNCTRQAAVEPRLKKMGTALLLIDALGSMMERKPVNCCPS